MSTIPKIMIDQQLAEIGVRVTPAKVHIETPRPEMRISTEAAQMDIERKEPTFKINRKKVNSESGLKSTKELTFDFRNEGRNAGFETISTAVNDGNFIGDTAKPGNRVAQLAKHKFMKEPLQKELNIATMPKSRPEVIWDPGSMRINWSRHSIVIEWEGEYMPEMTVDPKCSVEIFLRNKPHFKITVVEDAEPYIAGRQVDEIL